MNSRQRVLAAIDHDEPDGVPVDLGSTPSSGISAIAYRRLLGLLPVRDTRVRVYEVVQQVAQPSDEVLDHFRIDAVDLGRAFNRHASDWCDCTLPDGGAAQQPAWFHPVRQEDGSSLVYRGEEAIAIMPSAAFSYDQAVHPFLDGYPVRFDSALDRAMGRIHWAALAHTPWDRAGEPGFWKRLRAHAQVLRLSSDRAIVLSAGCNLFEWGTFLRGMDKFLADLLLAPADVDRFLDALLVRHLESLEKICRAVGDIVDVIRLGDDLGMTSGPLMAPETYRRFFKPRHKVLCDYVKAHGRMRTFLHSCGSIYRLIPDLVEAGFEILNPVQTNARDMQPERLKREFGASVTFWGAGADTSAVLNRGTPAEVKDHVRANIEVLSPGGGFVFAAVHNILPDVPPENVVAMFEAVDEYR
jgi:uroporphyrinogen decarboxylase